jgi:PAS domain S-box-containing protein
VSKDPKSERSLEETKRRATSAPLSPRKRGNPKPAASEHGSSNGDVLDSLDFPISVINSTGKVIRTNECWEGSDPATAFPANSPIGLGMNYFDACRRASEAGSPQAAEALDGILGVCSGSIPTYELQYMVGAPHPERWYSLSAKKLRDRDEDVVVTRRDISNLKQTQARLRESEERFRLIVYKAPAMIWMARSDARSVYFNQQWLDFTGRTLDQELGNGWTDGIHPDDRPKYLSDYEEACAEKQSIRLEYRLRCAGGDYRWVLSTGVPIFRENGEFIGLIGSCIDISNRRATEETLVALSGRLINAQEEERSRIARELHDDLSQRMALLSIDIEQLAQSADASVPAISAEMRKLLIRVQEISSEMHRMSYELHPSKLDRLGLVSASMSLCKEFSRQQNVQVECSFKGIHDFPSRNVSLCLYRIIQEALQNVLKHSGASKAKVELTGSASEIRLRITDEGIGFDPESAGRKGGLGVLSMRERLRLVHGTFSIESYPNVGTRIEVTVPLVASGQQMQKGVD